MIERRTVLCIYVDLLGISVARFELGCVSLTVYEMTRSLRDAANAGHIQVLGAANLLELIATSDWTRHWSGGIN